MKNTHLNENQKHLRETAKAIKFQIQTVPGPVRATTSLLMALHPPSHPASRLAKKGARRGSGHGGAAAGAGQCPSPRQESSPHASLCFPSKGLKGQVRSYSPCLKRKTHVQTQKRVPTSARTIDTEVQRSTRWRWLLGEETRRPERGGDSLFTFVLLDFGRATVTY